MRMFNSRKGVSEVVANVLIVLLVIVGIAVIWSVVKPTIDKGAKGIQADCFTVSVEPVNCVREYPSSSLWNVTVKRNPGAGVIEGIDLIFEDASGNTVRNSTGTSTLTDINELETKTAPRVGSGFVPPSTPTKVNTVLRSGGQLCQVTSQPVNCA